VTDYEIKRDIFEQCYDDFDRKHTIMLTGALVMSSIHDHIQDWEKCLERNVAVYCPKMALAKEKLRMELANETCPSHERKAKMKKVNAVPEGYVLKSCNLDTGKHTGVESCSKRTNKPFSTMYDTMALHGLCGVPTELFVIV
jgi:hypothetical protein